MLFVFYFHNILDLAGDLGVAKVLDSSTAFAQSIVGTPYYLSPELCADLPYRDKSDVWALGVIVYEVRVCPSCGSVSLFLFLTCYNLSSVFIYVKLIVCGCCDSAVCCLIPLTPATSAPSL